MPDPQPLVPLTAKRASQIVSGFTGTDVLVVGDAMLDRFIVGRVTRISPEAPVPVVAFDHENERVGGAANVAHNVAALGGRTMLLAITGQDEAAARLANACRKLGLKLELIDDAGRQTTTKVRIVTERNLQVARVDYESNSAINNDVEASMVAAVREQGQTASAIVVSDYLKGCITERVMEAVLTTAKKGNVPVLVDPKTPHLALYAGATALTPNHLEAETATHAPVRTHAEAASAGRLFRTRAKCSILLITRGDQGMWLSADTDEGFLEASAREVADVTGAGDTVIATMGLALAAGASPAESAQLANRAAGIVVGRFGPAVVNPEELLATFSI
jgi:D-beta-D-heptose 7-phosphate kinase/D-beta-D-heptose 1-phosphate adenosyltransferase